MPSLTIKREVPDDLIDRLIKAGFDMNKSIGEYSKQTGKVVTRIYIQDSPPPDMSFQFDGNRIYCSTKKATNG